MKKASLILLGLLLCLNAFAFELSRGVFDNGRLSFIKHEGTGAFDSYLSMEINYAPVKALFEEIVKYERRPLKTRGEAHITVVTPVEYFEVLKKKVSIQEINDIALKSQIQNSRFSVLCLGKGSLKNEEAFFIVVKSEDLVGIRNKIQRLFEARGGRVGAFKAEHFFSHITIGFTSRDLHEADGVIKDERSCVADISIK